jgi:phosphohistidine phosphatase
MAGFFIYFRKMKTVTLVRHAKSTKSILDIRDIDRPLNERGYLDAYKIGERLAEMHFKADLFISSPAIRAFSTALIFADRLNYPENNIRLCKNLYETSADEYIEQITEAENSANSIVLFGHNPTISEAMSALLRIPFEDMPTTASICMSFKIDSWKKMTGVKGERVFYLTPKD